MGGGSPPSPPPPSPIPLSSQQSLSPLFLPLPTQLVLTLGCSVIPLRACHLGGVHLKHKDQRSKLNGLFLCCPTFPWLSFWVREEKNYSECMFLAFKYDQLNVWLWIKNVMWTYLLWALHILRLCAHTVCTPNCHVVCYGLNGALVWPYSPLINQYHWCILQLTTLVADSTGACLCIFQLGSDTYRKFGRLVNWDHFWLFHFPAGWCSQIFRPW